MNKFIKEIMAYVGHLDHEHQLKWQKEIQNCVFFRCCFKYIVYMFFNLRAACTKATHNKKPQTTNDFILLLFLKKQTILLWITHSDLSMHNKYHLFNCTLFYTQINPFIDQINIEIFFRNSKIQFFIETIHFNDSIN